MNDLIVKKFDNYMNVVYPKNKYPERFREAHLKEIKKLYPFFLELENLGFPLCDWNNENDFPNIQKYRPYDSTIIETVIKFITDKKIQNLCNFFQHANYKPNINVIVEMFKDLNSLDRNEIINAIESGKVEVDNPVFKNLYLDKDLALYTNFSAEYVISHFSYQEAREMFIQSWDNHYKKEILKALKKIGKLEDLLFLKSKIGTISDDKDSEKYLLKVIEHLEKKLKK